MALARAVALRILHRMRGRAAGRRFWFGRKSRHPACRRISSVQDGMFIAIRKHHTIVVRSYYSCGLSEFLDACENDIMATMRKNDIFEPSEAQDAAWSEQIAILQDQLRGLDSGHIMFEYTIPRMGKRADTVLIHDDFVFVMEFKVNKDAYHPRDEDQCTDYALDLKNFHEASHCASIVPVLVATKAGARGSMPTKVYDDGIYHIARANAEGITGVIRHMRGKTPGCGVAASDWGVFAVQAHPDNHRGGHGAVQQDCGHRGYNALRRQRGEPGGHHGYDKRHNTGVKGGGDKIHLLCHGRSGIRQDACRAQLGVRQAGRPGRAGGPAVGQRDAGRRAPRSPSRLA